MKLFIVLAAVSLAQAGRLDRGYLPPNNGQATAATASRHSSNGFNAPQHTANGFSASRHSFNGFSAQDSNAYANAPATNVYAQNAYSGFETRPERDQAARERNAAILRQDNSNDGETYSYAYETENGIYAEENRVATNGVQAQGGYSYTGDDGKVYSIRYTADENGFVPQGDHLPTPPPIPEAILKALEQNARDEAAGIYDDGSFAESKYSSSSQQQSYNSNAQPINYNRNSAAVNKAYLPPHAQRNHQRNGY